LADFSGYFDYVKTLNPDDGNVKLICQDKEVFIALLNDPQIRNLLFSIDDIKTFFKQNRITAEQVGHLFPLIAIRLLISILYLIKENINFRDFLCFIYGCSFLVNLF
jgi:hypothetical protein